MNLHLHCWLIITTDNNFALGFCYTMAQCPAVQHSPATQWPNTQQCSPTTWRPNSQLSWRKHVSRQNLDKSTQVPAAKARTTWCMPIRNTPTGTKDNWNFNTQLEMYLQLIVIPKITILLLSQDSFDSLSKEPTYQDIVQIILCLFHAIRPLYKLSVVSGKCDCTLFLCEG